MWSGDLGEGDSQPDLVTDVSGFLAVRCHQHLNITRQAAVTSELGRELSKQTAILLARSSTKQTVNGMREQQLVQ